MPLFRTIRSGPFRLALLFAAIFAVGSIVLVVAVEAAVAAYAQQVTSNALTNEAARLATIDRRVGAGGVAAAIRDRAASRQRPFRYLLTDKHGLQVAGDLPQSAAVRGWSIAMVADQAIAGELPDEPGPIKTYGSTLTSGARLVIGSDTHDVQELREWLDAVAL